MNQYPWLMLGDCLELMGEIPDESVDLILCDLPYGVTQSKWDIIIPFEPLWQQYWRVLKKAGACVLFGSEPFSSLLRTSQLKFFKYDWIWKKSRPTGFLNAKKQPLRNCEYISVFYRSQSTYHPQYKKVPEKIFKRGDGGGKIYGAQKNKPKTTTNNGLEHPYTLIEFDSEGNKYHPVQKPIALLEYLIKTYTNPQEVVLDNAMGSGSTGVACLNTDRKFIGIEKNKEYYETATTRLCVY